jgi:hypothetical protein
MNIEPGYSKAIAFYGYADSAVLRQAYADGLLDRPAPPKDAPVEARQIYADAAHRRRQSAA